MVQEAKERLLQTVKAKIRPDFRNEKIIIVFTFIIRDYYRRSAEPNVKDQFQMEIDELYTLIYNELKKPNPFLVKINSNRTTHEQLMDNRRILGNMGIVLGRERIKNDFYNKFNINKLILRENYMGIVCVMSFVFILLIFVVVLFTIVVS